MDIEQLRDPRVVPFLLSLAQDPNEPIEVRIVRILRAAHSCAVVAEPVALALCELLVDRTSPDLRVAAALTLAEFTAVRGVPAALGDIALDSAEPLDTPPARRSREPGAHQTPLPFCAASRWTTRSVRRRAVYLHAGNSHDDDCTQRCSGAKSDRA